MFAYILQFITLTRTNVLKREAHSKFMRHLLCQNELGSLAFLLIFVSNVEIYTWSVAQIYYWAICCKKSRNSKAEKYRSRLYQNKFTIQSPTAVRSNSLYILRAKFHVIKTEACPVMSLDKPKKFQLFYNCPIILLDSEDRRQNQVAKNSDLIINVPI